MWRGLPLLLAATALCLPVQAAAEAPEPVEWLARMDASLHTESYHGTFVLQRGHRIDSIRVVHAADQDGYRERLETLTGPEREILRTVERVGVTKGVRSTSDEETPGAPVHLLNDHDFYVLETQGTERVAGHRCELILARAVDTARYSHRYCLHSGTALPLLSELYDPRGRLLERLAFTTLELVDEVAEADLEPTREDAEHIRVRAGGGHEKPEWDAETGLGGWHFGDLPGGFRTIAATERSIGESGSISRHFVLSDGLASISVYVEPVDGDRTFEGATRAGATHAVARVVSGHQVTAVGDAPVDTVKRVINAVVHDRGNDD